MDETKVLDLKQELDGSSIASSEKRRGSSLKPPSASLDLVSRDELTEVGSHISGWDNRPTQSPEPSGSYNI